MCWIKLYRKFTEWEWYPDINCRVVFLHLLLTANWKPKKWKGIEIGVGELVIGREALAEAVGISVQQCRTALKKLVNSEAIEVEATKQFSKIKILNYKFYQNQPTTNQVESVENTDVEDISVSEVNQQLTNNQPTTNQQLTTTKELKNDRIKEYNNNSGCSSIYNINNIYRQSATAADNRNVCKFYQENVGVLTPRIAELLSERIEAQGEEMVLKAIEEAVECGVRSMRYIEKVLISWEDLGLKTVEDVVRHKAERKALKAEVPRNVANSKFRNYPESYEITEQEKAMIDKIMREAEECG